MSFLNDMFSLKGKLSIVTGAARGNGEAISIALASAGAKVLLVDILANELSEVARKIKLIGGESDSYVCDLTNEKELHDFISYINTCGCVDILVNNAGVTYGHHAIGYPDDYWDRTYKVNLKAPYKLSIAVAELMRNSGGSIINITSLGAQLAFPDNIAYVSFKGALKQFSKALAYDLAKYSIRVNNIGPGYIKTDMTDKSWNDPSANKLRRERTMLGRWGNPEDLSSAVIFLASDSSSYITAQDIYVDGGWIAKGL